MPLINRSLHGGKLNSVSADLAAKTRYHAVKQEGSKNSVKMRSQNLADIFCEYVRRLPDYQIVKNKKTGKAEKVPVVVSRRRMVRDFEFMLTEGEYDYDEIVWVLDWLMCCQHKWRLWSVTSLRRLFPKLLSQCEREYSPYTDKEIEHIVEYLRWKWGYTDAESLIGTSLFAIESVLDVVRGSDIPLIISHCGTSDEIVKGHFDMCLSAGKSVFPLTSGTFRKRVEEILSRYGRHVDLNISMVQTWKRITAGR